MTAISHPPRVQTRAARPGEGVAIANLWHELWYATEAWDGYPGSHDPRTYANLAIRIDEHLSARAGRCICDKHIHLVADVGGVPCGQVEGQIARLGTDPATPITCQVQSLIVTESARGLGLGRVLLDALAEQARSVSGATPCVLSADVLERNPAIAFYKRLGFMTVGYCARIHASEGASQNARSSRDAVARFAVAQDAISVTCLDLSVATRLLAEGDLRFDGPSKTIDLLQELARVTDSNGRTFEPSRSRETPRLGPLAAHASCSSNGSPPNPVTLVSVDRHGTVLGAALCANQDLDLPFLPGRRAGVGRFAITPGCNAASVVASLIALACRLARDHGAKYLELADLSIPGSELNEAGLAAGATPWSRVVTKLA